jgi:hypothetical protein
MRINYTGDWQRDNVEIEGSITARDCLVRYRRSGEVIAVASIFRDLENLREEVRMARRAPPAHTPR